MNETLVAAGTALWLGVLTSISPCPLATNIAAVSFIGRRVGSPGRTLAAGLLYTAGRSLTYVALGALLVWSLLSMVEVSHFLQRHMNRLLGPVLILVGMVLLDLLRLPVGSGRGTAGLEKRAERAGLAGAVLLGVAFALSFCPVSAALFFGSLLPLAVKHESGLLFPALYGVGTAVPVLVFAVIIAAGAKSLGTAFGSLTRFERRARRVTGAVFVVVGIYYTITYVFLA